MVPQLFSGARGVVSYKTSSGDVRTLGVALDINVSVNDSVQQTFTLGSYNARGTDPTGTDVTVSLSTVIPVNSPDGSTPDLIQSNSIGLGLQESIVNVLTANSLEITLTDNNTEKLMATIRECRFSGKSLGNPAQGLATVRYNFVGIFDGANSNTASKLGYLPTSA